MMLVKTYVASSKIEGLGAYAGEIIPAGAEVWRFNPNLDKLIAVDYILTAPDQIREFLMRYTYPYHEDPNYRVLDSDDSRYMNHSDQPNVVFPDHNLGIAARDIQPGEELTCDYAGFMDQMVLYPSRQLAVPPTPITTGVRAKRRVAAGAR